MMIRGQEQHRTGDWLIEARDEASVGQRGAMRKALAEAVTESAQI
jgi:hypothetical protein